MQDFFQTFWEIVLQNRTRLIFIFLSSLVLHVLLRRFVEAITKFLFVAVRSFFFRDVKLFYDYRWQKSRQAFSKEYMKTSFSKPEERLFKHYYENLKLIYDYDMGHSTNYFDEALKNSRIKKLLHILLDLFYLRDTDHLLYKQYAGTKKVSDPRFDMNELSYASFIYRYNFIYLGVPYNEIKSTKSLQNALKKLLTKYQLFILQQKTDYLFQINFYKLYLKWLWVILILNIKAFKLYFDNALLRDIDERFNDGLINSHYLDLLNYKENMLCWSSRIIWGEWPYERLALTKGEREGMLFRRDAIELEEWDKIKKEIEILKKDSNLLIYPLLEFNEKGEKIINFEKFKHKDLIQSFQSDNYVNSKYSNLGIIHRHILILQREFYQNKGKEAWQVINKEMNRKNLNAMIVPASWSAKWYHNFKTYKTEFSFKYFEINDDTIDSFKELVLFVNNEIALSQESEKFSSLEKESAFINANYLMVRCDNTSQGRHYYKEYFSKLGFAALKYFIIMKKSWFFNSSNRYFDKYLNSFGFLLFFIIAFVLEEIYSEPVISFIEKTTTFFSSLF